MYIGRVRVASASPSASSRCRISTASARSWRSSARQSASDSLPVRKSSSASRISRYLASLAASRSARSAARRASRRGARRAQRRADDAARRPRREDDQRRAPRSSTYARSSSRADAGGVAGAVAAAARARAGGPERDERRRAKTISAPSQIQVTIGETMNAERRRRRVVACSERGEPARAPGPRNALAARPRTARSAPAKTLSPSLDPRPQPADVGRDRGPQVAPQPGLAARPRSSPRPRRSARPGRASGVRATGSSRL